MSDLSSFLKFVNIPSYNDKIYKEECVCSFHGAESEGGLFVSLTNFNAFSQEFAQKNFVANGHPIYLNIRTTRTKIPEDETGDDYKPTVMGIGVPGGFKTGVPKYDLDTKYSIVTFPDMKHWEYPDPNLPLKITQSVDIILSSDSEEKKTVIEEFKIEVPVSKFALDLPQINNGVKIPSSGWKCQGEGCDITTNLWLNLSDGNIGCGRSNWDGSGANNHAVNHFEATGFPLVVKLGTITAEGADVFSYHPSENDMVLDPKLKQHLTHFGINMDVMTKTDKTMAELEIELQTSYSWSRVTENNVELEPKYGPGYTGIENIGNSCYINSNVQILFSIPEFQQEYCANRDYFYERLNYNNLANDFFAQMSKLGSALTSGEYSHRPAEDEYQHFIKPRMFKKLIAGNHPEFTTGIQQDATEYFRFLISVIERNQATRDFDPTKVFKFQEEEKIVCKKTGKVKYNVSENIALNLFVPLERTLNAAEVADYQAIEQTKSDEQKRIDERNGVVPVLPIINFVDCVENFAQAEHIDFLTEMGAEKTTRLKTFPPYLIFSMKLFEIDYTTWKEKKLDVSIQVPDEIDLSFLRGHGIQPGEVPLEEGAVVAKPQFNEEVVSMIEMMGFGRNQAIRASFNNPGGNAEVAMDWLMMHMDDPDINDPLPTANTESEKPQFNEEVVSMIEMMGFGRNQAIRASFNNPGNNAEVAMDWLMMHMDDPDINDPLPAPTSSKKDSSYLDGGSKYRLFAFVNHLGPSTSSGHYICHIRKNGEWIKYNDDKVHISQNPPRDCAYMYFFERE